MYKKLFIPGPTHVREKILQAQAAPMLGHRSREYSDLQAEVTPKLQQLLYTKQRVYVFASSSTGVMEGSIRQASHKKILNTVCGAFSKRWHQITQGNGVACDKVAVARNVAGGGSAGENALFPPILFPATTVPITHIRLPATSAPIVRIASRDNECSRLM